MRRTLTTLFLLVLAACGGDGGNDVMTISGTIQLSEITTYEVTEGAVANIMVHRIGGDSGRARVDYATSDGTAVGGMDYRATSGTLVFADGVSGNQTISCLLYTSDAADE